METTTGTYALVLEAKQAFALSAGKLGRLVGKAGYYVYVGSAFGPGGVKARLKHHQRQAPRPHWHIDYLRQHLPFNEVWYTHDGYRRECLWVEALTAMSGAAIPFPGFGSSDCACDAHLIHFKSHPFFRAFRKQLFSSKKDHAAVRQATYKYLTEL